MTILEQVISVQLNWDHRTGYNKLIMKFFYTIVSENKHWSRFYKSLCWIKIKFTKKEPLILCIYIMLMEYLFVHPRLKMIKIRICKIRWHHVIKFNKIKLVKFAGCKFYGKCVKIYCKHSELTSIHSWQ